MTPEGQTVELAEIEANEDLYDAAPPGLGMGRREFGGAPAFRCPACDVPMLNRVVVLKPLSDGAVGGALEWYRAAGVRNFYFQVPPWPALAETTARLAAHGLVERTRWVKMLRDGDPPPVARTDLRIEIAGAGAAATFARTVCAGFPMPDALAPWIAASVGRPGWTHYLARAGDDAVAAAALRLSGGVCWLGIAATLPAARNRGGQSALLARRIADALAGGYSLIVTETGEDTADRPNPSYRNMVRSGFRLVHARQNWGLPPPS